jgi:hypothetical protein
MKKLLFILVLASLFSCNYHSKSKVMNPDTATIFVGYHNPYQGGSGLDTAIRIIKDSAHIDGDAVEHLPDTSYYIRVAFPLVDPKDSTHTKPLKTSDGKDSAIVRFMFFPPSSIFATWGAPTPYHINTQTLPSPHKPNRIVK